MYREILKSIREIIIGLIALAVLTFFNLSREESKPPAPPVAAPVQIFVGEAADQEVYAVVYSATWCGPCRGYKAAIVEQMPAAGWIVCDDLAKPGASKAHIRFTTDEALYAPNKITFIPTTAIYRRGKEVDRIVGITTPEKLADAINNEMKKGIH